MPAALKEPLQLSDKSLFLSHAVRIHHKVANHHDPVGARRFFRGALAIAQAQGVDPVDDAEHASAFCSRGGRVTLVARDRNVGDRCIVRNQMQKADSQLEG